MRTPVGVRVARRREDAVTLVQELPFLALGNAVTDDAGRSGKIARVAVSIDHGVPRLVIELAYDDAHDAEPPRPPAVRTPEPSSERRRDATLGYDQRPSAPPPRTVRMRRDDTNREMTLTFRTHTPYADERVALAPPPAPAPRESFVDLLLGRFAALAAMFVALIRPGARPLVQ